MGRNFNGIQVAQLVIFNGAILFGTLAVGLRFWARRVTGSRLQWNDFLMVVAWVTFIGLAAAGNLAVVQGDNGKHLRELQMIDMLNDMPLLMKLIIAIPPLLITSNTFVKLSITHYYVAVFPNHLKMRWACYVHFVFVILSWIGGMLACFLICNPLDSLWKSVTDPRVKPQCGNIKQFWLAQSIVALVFDITCVMLPMPLVWSLNMSLAKKLRITMLFGMGFIICGITIARLYQSEHIDFNDITWRAAPTVIFSVLEPALGIITGCVPQIWPLIDRRRKRREIQEITSLGSGNGWGSTKDLEAHEYPLTTVASNEGRKKQKTQSWNQILVEREVRVDYSHDAALLGIEEKTFRRVR